MAGAGGRAGALGLEVRGGSLGGAPLHAAHAEGEPQ